MKTNSRIVLLSAIILSSMVYGCKQAEEASEEANYDINSETTEKAVQETDEVTKVVSSSAAVETKKSNRKFLRTADIKFKVKNEPRTYSNE